MLYLKALGGGEASTATVIYDDGLDKLIMTQCFDLLYRLESVKKTEGERSIRNRSQQSKIFKHTWGGGGVGRCNQNPNRYLFNIHIAMLLFIAP